jgi:hypothetical protein
MNYITSILSSVYSKITSSNKEEKKSIPVKQKRKTIPKTIRNKVWRKYCGNSLDSKCFCCQEHLSYECWEAGHVIPDSKGGQPTIENLRPICLACNRSMGTMNMMEFMKKYKLPGKQNKSY